MQQQEARNRCKALLESCLVNSRFEEWDLRILVPVGRSLVNDADSGEVWGHIQFLRPHMHRCRTIFFSERADTIKNMLFPLPDAMPSLRDLFAVNRGPSRRVATMGPMTSSTLTCLLLTSNFSIENIHPGSLKMLNITDHIAPSDASDQFNHFIRGCVNVTHFCANTSKNGYLPLTLLGQSDIPTKISSQHPRYSMLKHLTLICSSRNNQLLPASFIFPDFPSLHTISLVDWDFIIPPILEVEWISGLLLSHDRIRAVSISSPGLEYIVPELGSPPLRIQSDDSRLPYFTPSLVFMRVEFFYMAEGSGRPDPMDLLRSMLESHPSLVVEWVCNRGWFHPDATALRSHFPNRFVTPDFRELTGHRVAPLHVLFP